MRIMQVLTKIKWKMPNLNWRKTKKWKTRSEIKPEQNYYKTETN